MFTRELFIKYHKKVSFPWSAKKIRKAGEDPTMFLIGFGKELNLCEDSNTPQTKELIELLNELSLLSVS